jgi:hypothetical protein
MLLCKAFTARLSAGIATEVVIEVEIEVAVAAALAVGVISATTLSALVATSAAPRVTGDAELAVRASASGSLDPSETASTSALSAFFLDLDIFLLAVDAARGSTWAAETLGVTVCAAMMGAGAGATTAESRVAVGVVLGGWGIISDDL